MLPRGDRGHTAILALATAVSACGTAIYEVSTANLALHTAISPFNTANQPRRQPHLTAGPMSRQLFIQPCCSATRKKTTAQAFAWAVVPFSSKPR